MTDGKVFTSFNSQKRALTKGRSDKNSGRANHGRISVRRRGGGHKQLNRTWGNRETQAIVVETGVYNPKSSSSFSLLITTDQTNKTELHLETTANFVRTGAYLKGFPKNPCNKMGPRKDFMLFEKDTNQHRLFDLPNGTRCPLYMMSVQTPISSLEIQPGSGPKLVRAAGTFGTLVRLEPSATSDATKASDYRKGVAWVELPSKEIVELPWNVSATVGIAPQGLDSKSKGSKLYKAGQNRWRGKRPKVRGVAMNPVDHPHGGGEKATKGGRPSVSPWGKLAKGKPTRNNRKTQGMRRIKSARLVRIASKSKKIS
jgi:large subunit ribosomal protein L2